MKLPFRKKAQPIITQQPEQETVKSVVTDPDDQPFESVEPARQVQPELMQFCSNCKTIGATHQFVNGDLYLGRLEHNYLCDTCHEQREARRTRHNVANKSTVLEHPAVTTRPRKKALVSMNGGVIPAGTIAIVGEA